MGGLRLETTLGPVPKQSTSRDENAANKAGVFHTKGERQLAKRRQKGTEDRWTVLHGKNHYGYKNHVTVDKKNKLIRKYTVTNA